MSLRSRNLSIALLAAGMTACGGGGGGGGSTTIGGTTTTVLPALALTGGNAEAAAGQVANGADAAVGAGSTGSVVITGVAVQTGDRPALAEFMRWSLETLSGLRGQIAPNLTGVVVNSSVGCTGGGSIAVNWDDADNSSDFSTGDSLSMTFSSCVEFGVTIGGALSLTGLTLSGDPQVVAPWSMGADFAFTNLSFNDGIDSLRINGDMAFSATTANGLDIAVGISGTTLSLRENALTTTTLRSFVYDYTENLNTTAYSLDYSGTVDIGSLSGRVTFATTSPFTGSDILSNWPTSGALLITGASGSTVTLTALGGDNIQLDVDANGDTAVDQVISSTWTNATSL